MLTSCHSIWSGVWSLIHHEDNGLGECNHVIARAIVSLGPKCGHRRHAIFALRHNKRLRGGVFCVSVSHGGSFGPRSSQYSSVVASPRCEPTEGLTLHAGFVQLITHSRWSVSLDKGMALQNGQGFMVLFHRMAEPWQVHWLRVALAWSQGAKQFRKKRVHIDRFSDAHVTRACILGTPSCSMMMLLIRSFRVFCLPWVPRCGRRRPAFPRTADEFRLANMTVCDKQDTSSALR